MLYSLAFLTLLQEFEVGNGKWHGSVGGIVGAPIDKVWNMIARSEKLPEWMPMVEKCTDLAGEEGNPGYVRLVSGFMFPQQDGERSWVKEKLVSMDSSSRSYVYRMEASNVGLDGSVNSLKLVDYGDNSTLIDWSFEISPLEGAREDSLIDYLGYLYKSCINRIEGAIEAASKKV
jgi:carbon monoxide dehydrogenase subunit G